MSITAIMLSWKRPTQVREILDDLRTHGLVSEAIVWDNNSTTLFSDGWTKLVISDCDMGLFTRFAAMTLARNECCLIQDDDLLLPHATITALYRQWEKQPDRIHGIFGRQPRHDGTYRYRQAPFGDVPIVLTRVLVCHRRLAAAFFRHLEEHRDLFNGSVPYGNGEDIFFSYVARAENGGKPNRTHDLPVKELPSPDPICKRPGHNSHRTKMVQECERWMENTLRKTNMGCRQP